MFYNATGGDVQVWDLPNKVFEDAKKFQVSPGATVVRSIKSNPTLNKQFTYQFKCINSCPNGNEGANIIVDEQNQNKQLIYNALFVKKKNNLPKYNGKYSGIP